GLIQFVFVQKRIKTAKLSIVGEFHAMNIVRCCIKLFSFFNDLGWRDENELGLSIDKSRDQPWTCHTIYFRAFTCNPGQRFAQRMCLLLWGGAFRYLFAANG